MSFTPTYKEDTLGVLVGTVGPGVMNAGSAALGPVGFVPLPGRSTANSFTPDDATNHRIVTVMGAGVAGGLLIAKVLTYVDANNVVLDTAASTSTVPGISNTTIFRPVPVLEGSIEWSDQITSHNQGKFTAKLLGGLLPPVAGQPFMLTSTDPSVGIGTYGTFAGGEIDAVADKNYAGTGNNAHAECALVSYEAVLSRRVMVAKTYSGLTMKQIAQDIVTNGLTAEFFGLTSPTGPTPSLLTIQNLSYVYAALQDLMKVCSLGATSYYFKTDQWRNVVIAAEAGTAAPWSISDSIATDGNATAEVANSSTRDKYGNQVYAQADKGLGDDITETITNHLGVGIYRALSLKNKAGVPPKLTIAGSAKTVWVSPIDPRTDSTAVTIPAGYDWAWPDGSDYLFTNGSLPGVNPGQSAVIVYQIAAPASSLYLYAAGVSERSAVQGGSGLHETIVQISDPIKRSELDAKAQSLATSLGVLSQSVEITTYRGGLQAGMGITVHLTDVAASGVYLIESVTLAAKDGWPVWTVKATIGALVGDWIPAFAEALGLTSSSGGGSGNVEGINTDVLQLQFATSAGQQGVAFTALLIATGGLQPYTYSILSGSLPAGLTLNASTGVISGVPTTPGPSSFVARVTDSGPNTVDISCSINIVQPSGSSVLVAVSTLVGSDLGHSTDTLADPVTRLVGFRVGITATFAAVPTQYATLYLSKDNGTTWYWVGWPWLFTQTPQTVQLSSVRPATAGTWKVALMAGKFDGDASVGLATGSLPAGTIVSAGFVVGALAAPGATLGTGPTIPAGTNFDATFPYDAQDPAGKHYWKLPSIVIALAGAYADPNAFVINATFQDLDAGGDAIGPQHIYGDVVVVNGSVDLGKLEGNYGADGFSYERTGNIAAVRLKLYASSRLDQNTTSWTNPAASTPQTDVGGGAGYLDITVAVGGAVPPNALLSLPVGAGRPPNPNLQIDPGTGQLVTPNTNSASSIIRDPSFAYSTPGVLGFSGGLAPMWDFAVPNGGGVEIRQDGGNSDAKYARLSGAATLLRQTVSVTPGFVFFVQMAVRSSNTGGDHSIALNIYWVDSTGKFIAPFPTIVGTVAGYVSAWENPGVSGYVTAPAGAASAVIEIANNFAEPGFWDVDDVSMQVVLNQATSVGTTSTAQGATSGGTAAFRATGAADSSEYGLQYLLLNHPALGEELLATANALLLSYGYGSGGLVFVKLSDDNGGGYDKLQVQCDAANGPKIFLNRSGVSYTGYDGTVQAAYAANKTVKAGVILN